MSKSLNPSDLAGPSECLCHIEPGELTPLPPPYEDFNQTAIPPLKPDKIKNIEASLDDTVAIGIPKPANKQEEEELIRRFLAGLQKLFEKKNNWTFLQPLMLSMVHCAKCQTCSDACPAPDLQQISQTGRENHRQVHRRYRSELDNDRPPCRVVLPLHPLPALRRGLPDRRGQRPDQP